MVDVISALAPVFLLIAFGWGARVRGLATAEQFGAVNRFGYFVLYPAFLFTLVSGADFSVGDSGEFVAAVLLGFLGVSAFGLLLFWPFRNNTPAFTSVFQGVARWNGFSLLAAAAALYGDVGTSMIGIVFGPLVFMVNIICVIVLARWGSARATSMRAVLDQIIANPLVLGCAAGLLAQAVGVRDFGPLSDALRLLGQAAMPVALLCVGAGLDFKALRGSAAHIGAACFGRLLVAPAIVYGVALLMGLSPLSTAVAVGVAATPTAAAGYTLAHEMGGDARLMAAIITATTLFSAITMPLVIGLALH
ncbi:MAG TPA: AEC family transporter [Terricaulis sp.]|nr:AEC family transporter [Terricaulis sp.]